MAGYKKVLVLLDLSESSDQVAMAGRDLAAYSDAAMVILHVVDFVPVEPLGESLIPTVQIEDELLKRSREKIDALIARLALARAAGRVEAGNTKAEILRVAEEERGSYRARQSRTSRSRHPRKLHGRHRPACRALRCVGGPLEVMRCNS